MIFQQDEAPKEMYILQVGIIIVTTTVVFQGSDDGKDDKDDGNKEEANVLTEKARSRSPYLC